MRRERQEEKNQRRLVQPETSVPRKAREEDEWITVQICPERHEEKNQRRLVQPEACMPRKARNGGLVIYNTNASRETRRRTTVDWFNQKQVCRERHECTNLSQKTRGGELFRKNSNSIEPDDDQRGCMAARNSWNWMSSVSVKHEGGWKKNSEKRGLLDVPSYKISGVFQPNTR